MRLRHPTDQRTALQESGPFDPRVAIPAEVVFIHGLRWRLSEKVTAWQAAGYSPYAMTSVAWGSFGPYIYGEWDGTVHTDDIQTTRTGQYVGHGQHDTYFMVPTAAFTAYLIDLAKAAVDVGVLGLVLEEPEFWVDGMYSPGFQREWAAYFGTPWQDPAVSLAASYQAAQLQQHLLGQAVNTICTEVAAYAQAKGLADFRCAVATHSLLNYAQWRIVSPASQLAHLTTCDSIIAQVWTGTARQPNMYQGNRRSRPFETALCEYAAITALARDTNTRLWFLADPIADDPKGTWAHYRQHWHSTVTASLLFPDVCRYEVMPWPRRVFLPPDARRPPWARPSSHSTPRLLRERLRESISHVWSRFGPGGWEFPATSAPQSVRAQIVNAARLQLTTPRSSAIPAAYGTELQIVFTALADMDWPPDQITWVTPTLPIGLCISDTLQFQRGAAVQSDPDLSSFYGLALPLIAHGLPLQYVQLERFGDTTYLDPFRVLLLTYEGMKPRDPAIHTALAAWVSAGGTLLLFGQGDSYDGIPAWWNHYGSINARAHDHLLAALGLSPNPPSGITPCGKGSVICVSASPSVLACSATGAEHVRATVQQGLAIQGVRWDEGNVIALRRGPYVIAAGLRESRRHHPFYLQGLYIDLYAANLPILRNPRLRPGTHWLLYDLQWGKPHDSEIIAAGGRISAEESDATSLHFCITGAAGTHLAARVRLPRVPMQVETHNGTGTSMPNSTVWDGFSHTLLLRCASDPQGVQVHIAW